MLPGSGYRRYRRRQRRRRRYAVLLLAAVIAFAAWAQHYTHRHAAALTGTAARQRLSAVAATIRRRAWHRLGRSPRSALWGWS